MRRRTYLATLGITTGAALAGCSSDTGSNNSSSGGGGNTEASGGGATTAQSGGQTTTSGGGGTETASSGGETTAESSGSGGETQTESETETETETQTETETETETQTETSTETATDTTTASSGGGFGPKTFSGSGTSTESGIELSPGPVTAEYSYDGDANFIVTLITLEGESYQDLSLANVIGQADGSQVTTASAGGGYKLNVEADGEWEITIEQPTNPQPESLPIDANGEGPSYIGPFDFSGPTTFHGTHDGSSNFIVTPVPVDPSNMAVSVFNEIGQFEGDTTARVNGLAYLNINADGSWTLSTGG